MATENILMAAVSRGGDRQDLHERIRQHSQDAARRVKLEGGDNDLLQRLAEDPAFSEVSLDAVMADARFHGRSPQQVDQFIEDFIVPLGEKYGEQGEGPSSEVSV